MRNRSLASATTLLLHSARGSWANRIDTERRLQPPSGVAPRRPAQRTSRIFMDWSPDSMSGEKSCGRSEADECVEREDRPRAAGIPRPVKASTHRQRGTERIVGDVLRPSSVERAEKSSPPTRGYRHPSTLTRPTESIRQVANAHPAQSPRWVARYSGRDSSRRPAEVKRRS